MIEQARPVLFRDPLACGGIGNYSTMTIFLSAGRTG